MPTNSILAQKLRVGCDCYLLFIFRHQSLVTLTSSGVIFHFYVVLAVVVTAGFILIFYCRPCVPHAQTITIIFLELYFPVFAGPSVHGPFHFVC